MSKTLIRIKSKEMTAIFLIELIILMPIAIVDAMTISNIRAEEITLESAKIKWETSQNSEGKVSFGENTSLGNTASSPDFVSAHSIPLANLKENQQYYFEIISDNGTQELTDNNAGQFYSFSTLAIGPLFINASIPSYLTTRRFDIIGKSRRYAVIDMFVNNNAPRTLAAGSNGNFIFPDVSLNEGSNTIRFDVKSGNEVLQRTYTPKVDTIAPSATLSPIPDVVSEKLTLNGTVSEKSTIRFYVTDAEKDFTPPPKVLGLKSTSIKANIVELAWSKINIPDFLRYIIYRNNKPISVIADKNYNDYSDALVNSNQSYTYEIAAMDKAGNIGEKSEPLIVTALAGGVNNRPDPQEADIQEGIEGLKKAISIKSGSAFKEELDMGTEDGFYNIKVEAVDEAGNSWAYNKDVLLDTKLPEIEIISPKSNAQIYENYADSVTIRGKTEPGARIYLYVKRTPLGIFNRTYDVAGLPDEIQQIPESELRAGCTFAVLGEEKCKPHADYETVAGANGNFEFEKVDLTSVWAGAMKITEYPTGEPYINNPEQQKLKDFMESNLVFVGVDAAGKKGVASINYQIVNCWSTDLTWDATPLPQYQSPTFLSIERLKEGSEAIYFYLNFTYHGQGTEGKVTNMYLAKACGTGYLEEQKRYNYSCSILGSCTSKLSPTGKTAYIACPLTRIEGMERWMEKEWKSFIDGVSSEMTFPFKLTLSYDEMQENKTMQRQKEHTLCTEVGYVVDASYINPKEVLPDWLLYDFVSFLNTSINTLNDWIMWIREILEWVAIGCVATILIKFVVQIYRRITCHYDKFFKKLQDMGGSSQQADECQKCIENDPEAKKAFDKNRDFQNSLSDTCLKVCYHSCSSAWSAEALLYKTYRFACDRTFGHPTPSRWTEKLDDTQISQKLSEGSGCANDQSVRGRPLRAIQCISVEEKYRRKGEFSLDDKCLEITTHDPNNPKIGGTTTLYKISPEKHTEGENVYTISVYGGDAPSIKYTYVIKQNEDNYLTYLEEDCPQICRQSSKDKISSGVLTTASGGTINVGGNINKPVQSEKGAETKDKTVDSAAKKNYVVTYGCLTPNQCISYAKDAAKLKVDGKDEIVDVNTATPMGYTKDCFDPVYVWSEPNRRIECCCINSETGAIPGYYQPADVESKESKSSAQFVPATKYEEMEWSYRYNKINYKQKKYNENRYISGRDFTACFGRNDLLHDATTSEGEVGNLLTIDPMKNHLAAFQCVAISQIYNRLMIIQNIMVALENCLLSIRTTGKADTGVCKEIFSQYICSFIWKIITWIRDGCLPFGSGVDFTKSENSVLEAVSVGMNGVWNSVADTQTEIQGEYGNAELNNLLGLGEQDVFRKLCLLAFGYDWEIDLDSIMDIAYNTPYATLVQPVLQSREFITFDPTTYNAKYEYRASWLINPGCDLDSYEVYLACITRNDMYKYPDINCVKQKDPYGKNCDCLDLPPDKAPPPLFYYKSPSRMSQNQLMQVDSSQIDNRIKTSSYRYDHLKFVLNVNRDMAANKGDTTKCFPQGHADGVFYFPITDYTAREVAGCTFDATTGTFSCQQGASFFYEQGNAYFTEIIPEKNPSITDITNPDKVKVGATYYAGNSESIGAVVKYSKDDRKQCLIARLMEKDLSTVIKAPAPIELKQGITNGQENIGTIYSISERDLSGGSSSGLIIGYDDERTNERKTAAGKLSYAIVKSPVRQGGGSLEFIDDPANGAGISFSRDSTDSYSYKQSPPVKFRDVWSADSIEIDMNDIGAKIKVKGASSTQSNPPRYIFIVESAEGASGAGSLTPRYYLHLDLRHPVAQDSSCGDVAGPGYDETNVIISNGIRQSVDIPIYVMPGQRNIEKCESNHEREEITFINENNEKVKQDNSCVCGTGSVKNCPRTSPDYKFCYGQCRKYPRCEFAKELNSQCVCDPSIRPDNFDCGSDKAVESAFPDNTRKGWYCYEDVNKVPRCQQAQPNQAQISAGDTTPLQVAILSPITANEYSKSQPLNIQIQVIDDKPDSKETCTTYVQNTPSHVDSNKENKQDWVINYPYNIPANSPPVLEIYAVCTDNSMVSGNKAVQSDKVSVNIIS